MRGKIILFLTAILVILVAAIFVYTPLIYAQELGDKRRLVSNNLTGLTLTDRNGEPFFVFDNAASLEYLTLDRIPLTLQQALIATEDRDFYTNPGFSLRGMARAVMVNLREGRIAQGGSTITQQLVKNTVLSGRRSIARKAQEIALAYMMSRQYSKEDILEMYLNSVYFGEGAIGLENAARTYFNRPAQELTLAQSALLVGLLRQPSAVSPLSHDPAAAKARQGLVLEQMVDARFITVGQMHQALQEPLRYTSQTTTLNQLAPHFALMVKKILDQKYGPAEVIERGLVVKTTLNREWQSTAHSIVANQVQRLAPNRATNGAAVVIDPHTGQILAMVGSVDWSHPRWGQVNMATTPRQVGSAFKPVIYAAAFEQDIIHPATILQDNPIEYPGNYKPRDYDGNYRGSVTVRRALANSLNIPSVEVMDKVGVPGGLTMAHRLGITSLGTDASRYGLSLVLGAGEVSLIELTNAYATFAAEGVHHPPVAILEVKDKFGTILETTPDRGTQALSSDIAYLITSILSDTKTRREEFGSTLDMSRTAAIKTGTAQDYRNALTVAYTPRLAVGAWVGNNDNSPMDQVAGSLGAAPIAKNMLQQFLAGTPDEPFPAPATVTQVEVCPYTGTASPLASASGYPEFFAAGNIPADTCSHDSEITTSIETGEPPPHSFPTPPLVPPPEFSFSFDSYPGLPLTNRHDKIPPGRLKHPQD